MRIALLMGVLVLMGVSPVARAQQTPAPDATFEETWVLHLEDELDARRSLVTYLGAPLGMVEGLVLGGLAIAATDMNDWGRLSLGVAGGLWLASGVSYYATDDLEGALQTFAGLNFAGLGLLHASSLAWNMGCGAARAECGDRVTEGDVDRVLLVNGVTGIALSLLMLWVVLQEPPPRVTDLRVGFAEQNAAEQHARVLEHLRARERVRRKMNIATTLIALAATGGFVYATTQADTRDGRTFAGTMASLFGGVTVFGVIWALVEPQDSERFAAGELPDE